MSTTDNISLLKFFSDKLGNLIKKLLLIPSVQEKKFGIILINSLGQLKDNPEAVVTFLDQMLKPYYITDEKTQKVSLSKEKFSADEEAKATVISQELKIPIEECVLGPEVQDLLYTYFNCFVDVHVNK